MTQAEGTKAGRKIYDAVFRLRWAGVAFCLGFASLCLLQRLHQVNNLSMPGSFCCDDDVLAFALFV
jgi:hypothetical protein